jgi:hypothetical protein
MSKTYKAGEQAGEIGSDGFLHIEINGQDYLAHELAWLLMTGELPPSEIEHIDGDKLNNAWANLRLKNNEKIQ